MVIFFYLIKVLLRGPHLLPGLVEKLNADTEKLLHQPVLAKEDGVVVRSRLGGCPHREGEEGQQDTGSFENPFDPRITCKGQPAGCPTYGARRYAGFRKG